MRPQILVHSPLNWPVEFAAQLHQIQEDLEGPHFHWTAEDLMGLQDRAHLIAAQLWVEERWQLGGFVVYQSFASSAEVIFVFVIPQARACQLGRQLMNFGHLLNANGHCDYWSLQVHEENQIARSFYESLGYQVNRRLGHYYRDGSAAFEMVATRNALAQPRRV